MAVCSFMGHSDVYDADIQSRMQAAVDRLVLEHTALEFLVYPNGRFSYEYLLVALNARTNHPQKVTITLVSEHAEAEEMGASERSFYYLSDRVMTPNVSTTAGADVATKHKKVLLWIAEKSTHIFSYYYGTLYDADSRILKTLDRSKTMSFTAYETEAAIEEAASHMTEKEQIIFRKMNDGCTLIEAGKAIGVKGERARQILQHGCRTIRRALKERYNRELDAAHQEQHLRSCGLFALGEATYCSLTRFKYIMEILSSAYSTSKIYVEQSCVPSAFSFVLTDSCLSYSSRQAMHFTALIGDSPQSNASDDMEAIQAALCPPCNDIEFVSLAESKGCIKAYNVITNMIDRFDFCLCDLSATPFADEIKQYAAQAKRAILLDLSSANTGNQTRRIAENRGL